MLPIRRSRPAGNAPWPPVLAFLLPLQHLQPRALRAAEPNLMRPHHTGLEPTRPSAHRAPLWSHLDPTSASPTAACWSSPPDHGLHASFCMALPSRSETTGPHSLDADVISPSKGGDGEVSGDDESATELRYLVHASQGALPSQVWCIVAGIVAGVGEEVQSCARESVPIPAPFLGRLHDSCIT